MHGLPLLITLMVSVIIIGGLSDAKSRQDSVLQKFLGISLVILKSNKSGIFLVNWVVSGFMCWYGWQVHGVNRFEEFPPSRWSQFRPLLRVFGVIMPCSDETITYGLEELCILFILYCVFGWWVYCRSSNAGFPCFHHDTCGLQEISLMFIDFVIFNAASFYNNCSAVSFTIRVYCVTQSVSWDSEVALVSKMRFRHK